MRLLIGLLAAVLWMVPRAPAAELSEEPIIQAPLDGPSAAAQFQTPQLALPADAAGLAPTLPILASPQSPASAELPQAQPQAGQDPIAAAQAVPARAGALPPAQAALARLGSAKAPGSAASWTFDAQLPAQGSDPVLADLSATPAAPARLAPASRVGRLRGFMAGPPGSFERRVKDAFALGVLAGIAAPFVLHARPWGFLPMHVAFGIAFWAGLWAAASLALKLPRLSGLKTAVLGRRARAAVLAGVLAAGLGAAYAPQFFHGPMVKAAASATRFVHNGRLVGPAFSQETMRFMSANAEGRGILDELKDVAGRPRLPSFFIVDQADSDAEETDAVYIEKYDAIFIPAARLADRGWTPAQFLASPDLQRRYADSIQPTLAHELVHAAQGRRSLFSASHFSESYEVEAEAFLRQHYFIHAMLEADPARKDIDSADLADYETALDSLDAYLGQSLSADYYQSHGAHINYPPYARLLARARAEWPRHRAEGYELLARRYATVPVLARRYQREAERAQAEIR